MMLSRREAVSWMLAGLAVSRVPGRLFGESGGEPPFDPTVTGPEKKFGADGSIQRFPGNTVLCHLNQPGPQHDALAGVVSALRAETVDNTCLTWLPPSSYHMTVFEGALDMRRNGGWWPVGLASDASMQDCNAYVAERLRKFDLGFDPPIRMVVDENPPTPILTVFPLRPIDAAENRRLRNLRDRLSTALGIRTHNHDSYGFHTTFGYYIRRFGPENERLYRRNYARSVQRLRQLLPVIELGAPEYCLFESMAAFQTQFHLQHLKST